MADKGFMKKILTIVGVVVLLGGALAALLFFGDRNKAFHAGDNAGINAEGGLVSGDVNEPYIHFNKNYVHVGDALTAKLENCRETGIVYRWSIDGAEVEGETSKRYTVEADECFVTVEALQGETVLAEASLYVSALPVIYMDTLGGKIGDEYIQVQMTMSSTEEFAASNSVMYSGGAKIKLRGNSTRWQDKRPYKLKLDEKASLYGMGANKHWVLLANAIDHTFIRNKLTYDFSGDLGMTYMSSENVVLILNGSYEGVYQLCEQVRVSTTRVDIFDWDDLAEDAAIAIADEALKKGGIKEDKLAGFTEGLKDALQLDYSWISDPHTIKYGGETYDISDYVEIPEPDGGYLLEMDFYNFDNISSVKTNFMQPLYFSSPDPNVALTNSEMMDNARRLVQSFEYAVHSPDFIYHETALKLAGEGRYYDWEKGWVGVTHETEYSDPARDGRHYSEIFDMDSLVNNWIVTEFAMNWDSMKNSLLISKDIGGLGKIEPVWDFDWAYGNKNMFNIDTNVPMGWHTTNDYFTNEQYYQSVQWNRYLIRDPYFMFLCYNRYKEIRPTLIEDIIKEGGKLDTYAEEYANAGAANDERWSYSYFNYGGTAFAFSMKSLRSFIVTRVTWMDRQFADFETFVNSLGYYKTSGDLQVEGGADGLTVTTSDTRVTKVRVQVNGAAYKEDFDLTAGTMTILLPKEIFNEPGANVVNVIGLDAQGNYVSDPDPDRNSSENAEDVIYVQDYLVF